MCTGWMDRCGACVQWWQRWLYTLDGVDGYMRGLSGKEEEGVPHPSSGLTCLMCQAGSLALPTSRRRTPYGTVNPKPCANKKGALDAFPFSHS